jgi:hypothetical protein
VSVTFFFCLTLVFDGILVIVMGFNIFTCALFIAGVLLANYAGSLVDDPVDTFLKYSLWGSGYRIPGNQRLPSWWPPESPEEDVSLANDYRIVLDERDDAKKDFNRAYKLYGNNAEKTLKRHEIILDIITQVEHIARYNIKAGPEALLDSMNYHNDLELELEVPVDENTSQSDFAIIENIDVTLQQYSARRRIWEKIQNDNYAALLDVHVDFNNTGQIRNYIRFSKYAYIREQGDLSRAKYFYILFANNYGEINRLLRGANYDTGRVFPGMQISSRFDYTYMHRITTSICFKDSASLWPVELVTEGI